jgi:hypothetical protein
MAGRTFTKRRIQAIGWHTMADGSIVGLIRVDITQTDDPSQELGTKYFIGSVKDPGEPYKDAKKIIDTGLEFPDAWLKEITKEEHENTKTK